MTALIVYLDNLEDEWSEQLPESVRVAKFLTYLHEYFRGEFRGRQLPADTRKQAHEAALLVEKTSKRLTKLVIKPFGKRSHTTTTETKQESSEVQDVVTAPAKKWKRENSKSDISDKKDKSNIECWGCHQKGH